MLYLNPTTQKRAFHKDDKKRVFKIINGEVSAMPITDEERLEFRPANLQELKPHAPENVVKAYFSFHFDLHQQAEEFLYS